MNSNASLTSVNDIAPKTHVMRQLDLINLRFPPDELDAAAPPYENTHGIPEEKDSRHGEVGLATERDSRPSSRKSIQSQQAHSLGSASIRAGPRLSIGSMGSVPSSACDDHAARWRGQQLHSYSTTRSQSAPQSTRSQTSFPELLHEDPTAEHKNKHESFAPTKSTVPPAGICHGAEKLKVGSALTEARTITACQESSPTNVQHDSSNYDIDVESLKHKATLRKMARWSKMRKFVMWLAIIVASIALVAMVLLLSFHTSKKMTRAAFTGSTTIIFLCTSALLWAAERTMVETLIAMNIVIVYGIFLNGQIDVWLSYEVIQ
ncbi:hypothetical protein BLS_005273 [Venturia inaequalis]|uniref:Uncharacterized protein n=1 Tax=Venturia inaequalis TaxID=5025 RepID=A0A8H3Z717_VENIN|nr:hypothetical protein BLS_005273 [Venturia inaequalis]